MVENAPKRVLSTSDFIPRVKYLDIGAAEKATDDISRSILGILLPGTPNRGDRHSEEAASKGAESGTKSYIESEAKAETEADGFTITLQIHTNSPKISEIGKDLTLLAGILDIPVRFDCVFHGPNDADGSSDWSENIHGNGKAFEDLLGDKGAFRHTFYALIRKDGEKEAINRVDRQSSIQSSIHEGMFAGFMVDTLRKGSEAGLFGNDGGNNSEFSAFLREGYIISGNSSLIGSPSIAVLALSEHGLFNGLQTLINLIKWVYTPLERGQKLYPDELLIIDHPRIEIRAFHLDLKDLMPTAEYLKELIRYLAFLKYNCIVMEYEDKFPYKGMLAPVVHPEAFTEDEVNGIIALCKKHFISVIPLVQVFGHLEFILKTDEFRHLQETPDGKPVDLKKEHRFEAWSLCPLHDDSIKLSYEIVDQIARAHPDSKYIHIGADEVYQLGTCPKCREYLKTHTASELYVSYINKIAERVLSHGKIPIMWHDYLWKYPENLDDLNRKVVIMYWRYPTWRKGPSDKDEKKAGKILPLFELFHEKGFKTMGAPSSSSDFDLLIPNLRSRLENIAGHAIRVYESGSLGLLITSWSVCANPLDTQLMLLIGASDFIWNPPKNSSISDAGGWHSDNFDWDYIESMINLFVLSIPEDHRWDIRGLFTATEREIRIYPSDEALQYIEGALETCDNLKKTVGNRRASRICGSMRLGYVLIKAIADVLKQFRKLSDIIVEFSEADSYSAEFPTMDSLQEISETFAGFLDDYKRILDGARRYYIEETGQIKPGQWEIISEYKRYTAPEWLVGTAESLRKARESIDRFILDVLNGRMFFNWR